MPRKPNSNFQDSSGGGSPESAPLAAGAVTAAAGGALPMDHPDLKACTRVTLIFQGGGEMEAFLEPGWGWMDQRGVLIPQDRQPIAWRPL